TLYRPVLPIGGNRRSVLPVPRAATGEQPATDVLTNVVSQVAESTSDLIKAVLRTARRSAGPRFAAGRYATVKLTNKSPAQNRPNRRRGLQSPASQPRLGWRCSMTTARIDRHVV